MDMVTYGILSKRINGILSGVKSTEVQGSILIFNFTDGTSQAMTFPTPKDGVSITDVEVDANKHLIVTLSNNTTVDAGLISTVKGDKGDTGAKGKNGIDGKDGIDGTNGVDGISPTVTITESTGRHTVSITDKDGVKSFVVKDGSALDVDNYYTKDNDAPTNSGLITFDASKSNAIYGNSDTVQPPAVCLHYIIKASKVSDQSSDIIDDAANTTDKTWSAKKISESIPTTLPANGGNADTVNEHTVEDNVPAGIFASLPFQWELIGTSTPETGDTSTNTFKQTMSGGSPFCVYHSSGIFCFGNGVPANRGKLYGMTSGAVASVTYTSAGLLTVEVGSGTAYIYEMKTIN